MSLTSDDIAVLARVFSESGLDELHLTGPGTDLHLRRPGSPSTTRPASPSRAATVASPGVGIFLPRHPLHTEAMVLPGRRVRAGQAVALLRIGSLLRQVIAPAAGTLGAALVEEGAMVGFGTQLFAFHPDPPEVQS
jgi:acetyl-CoA carboxylase biotin carboxyl carrier protein